MNKKITIFAVILIVIGIVGTISSSIAAVPFATNYINKTIKKANEEVEIYEKKVDINKLDIDTKNMSVEIRKSNSDKIKIVQVGSYTDKTLTIENKDKVFSVKENDESQHLNIQVQGFGDVILSMINLGNNKIIIYVPNNVDIQADTKTGSLIVRDKDVLSSQIVFNTNQGELSLPKEVKHLEKLRLSSIGDINLKTSELLGINNVEVSTQGNVYLESLSNNIFIEDVENFIPESVNIIADRYSKMVYVESSIPISKNFNIENKTGEVYLNLPIYNYNMNFNLNSLNGINFENKDNNSSNMNKFEGSLNEIKNKNITYNVTVDSNTIDINKN
ncbi:DUF4097 family beta strand repeat-containing protein [Paraclostridium sordellii]|uniref:DUF4097 family beta strand repeat-containing protein n=1 Tax=Paraclostridium sordellii TaxID=1505 RepID=UPI0030D3C739